MFIFIQKYTMCTTRGQPAPKYILVRFTLGQPLWHPNRDFRDLAILRDKCLIVGGDTPIFEGEKKARCL